MHLWFDFLPRCVLQAYLKQQDDGQSRLRERVGVVEEALRVQASRVQHAEVHLTETESKLRSSVVDHIDEIPKLRHQLQKLTHGVSNLQENFMRFRDPRFPGEGTREVSAFRVTPNVSRAGSSRAGGPRASMFLGTQVPHSRSSIFVSEERSRQGSFLSRNSSFQREVDSSMHSEPPSLVQASRPPPRTPSFRRQESSASSVNAPDPSGMSTSLVGETLPKSEVAAKLGRDEGNKTACSSYNEGSGRSGADRDSDATPQIDESAKRDGDTEKGKIKKYDQGWNFGQLEELKTFDIRYIRFFVHLNLSGYKIPGTTFFLGSAYSVLNHYYSSWCAVWRLCGFTTSWRWESCCFLYFARVWAQFMDASTKFFHIGKYILFVVLVNILYIHLWTFQPVWVFQSWPQFIFNFLLPFRVKRYTCRIYERPTCGLKSMHEIQKDKVPPWIPLLIREHCETSHIHT